MAAGYPGAGYVPTKEDQRFFADLVRRHQQSREARYTVPRLQDDLTPPDASLEADDVADAAPAEPAVVRRSRRARKRLLFYDRLRVAFVQQRRSPSRRFMVVSIGLTVDGQPLLPRNGRASILTEASRRLHRVLHDGDTIVRFGGEFVLLLSDVGNKDRAAQALSRVCAELSEPFAVASAPCVVEAAVGSAVSGPEFSAPNDLMRAARAKTVPLQIPAGHA